MHRLAALAVLLASAAAAQPSVVGDWSGEIEGTGLTVILHVSEDLGELTSTLDVPQQGAADVPTGTTTYDDAGRFVVTVPVVGGLFEGVHDDDEIAGTWSQGGGSAPLVLARVAPDAPELAGPVRADTPQPPFPYREREVAISSADGITLAGTLTLPEGDGPFPAAVLVTGSGPQNRDEELAGHRPFLVLADHLARRGIAVLRYDDRGVGRSTGAFNGATTADFARDAQAAAEALAARPEAASVGILGHSEGGIVGPLAAGASDAVAYVVSLAGPAVPFQDILLDQLGRGSEVGRAAVVALLDEATVGDAATAPERAAAAYMATMGSTDDGLRDDEVAGLASVLAGPWGRYLLDYDPAGELRALRVPALAVYAARDRQVAASANVPAAVDALAGAPAGSRVVVLPGLNHLFQPSETGDAAEYGQIDTSFDPGVMDLVADWILAR